MTQIHLDAQRSGAASTLLAALDLLHTRERHADHCALDLGRAVTDRLHPTALTVATHAATAAGTRHVALSIRAEGVSADELWAVLADTVAEADGADEAAILVGDRFAGPPEFEATLHDVVAAQAEGRDGRAVVYPGHDTLVDTVSVEHVLTATAIDDVRVLAAGAPDGATPIFTRDFVRPRWRDGRLVLDTQPARGGVLVPFETPNPTPCCADHT